MIERLFAYLGPFIRYTARYPLRILLVSFITALAGFMLAYNLRIDNDLAKLIPKDYPSVQALEKLREQVGAENEVAVAIKSPSLPVNKQFARDIIDHALELKQPGTSAPYFTRAEFRREVGFLQNNAIYFATDSELDQLQQFLKDKAEEAKEEANPFYIEFEEEEDTATDSVGRELEQMYNELVGSEYYLSEDSLTLVVKLFPNGSQTDIRFIRSTYRELQNTVDSLSPHSYHPDMEVTLAGRFLRTLIEVETITADVKNSFGAGVLMLLFVVVAYFFYRNYRIKAGSHLSFRFILSELPRMPVIAVIMALPLTFSICWTFGIAYLAFGNLNIMTSTLGLLLFGMGIDFGIHFFARYMEERGMRKSIEDSAYTTFMTTGQAITVVGITTAAAFFILMIAEFKGFSEFGFIAGIGILFAIIAYIVSLPALLVLFERMKLLDLSKTPIHVESKQQEGDQGKKGKPKFYISLFILLLAVISLFYAGFNIDRLEFEYHFGGLEPEYERFVEVNRKARTAYSNKQTRNSAYIIVDKPEHATQVAAILKQRISKDTLSATVREVETFQDRFPMNDSAAKEKLERIEEIRSLLADPFLKDQKDEQLDRLRKAASTRDILTLDEVPDFLKNPFTSKDGEVGNLVIIYPSVGLSDGRNSMNFAEDVGRVTLPDGKVYYAGSTSIVAADMLKLMIEETPLMVSLTVVMIILFKLIILHRLKWVLLALFPLGASFLWMFGLMPDFGWKLNFYNLVVLPTVLGIGDDSGIHIVHRYLEEGKGSITKVLKSTGEHISVSSTTTVLGFSGLLFSIHPGMRSIGELAILGIILSLIASLFVLPALIHLLEKYKSGKLPTGKKSDEKELEVQD